LSCGAKPLVGWAARDGIQECREACGGHGYLAVSGLGKLRDDHDPNLTYEGDNNVLLQQTSNYLLSAFSDFKNDKPVSSPLHTIDIINDMEKILNSHFIASDIGSCCHLEIPLNGFRWLFCYLLKVSDAKIKESLQSGKDLFSARNDSQAYYCRSLSLAYIQCVALQNWYDVCSADSTPQSLKPVLIKLGCLYGLWNLEKQLATLYQGGYCQRESDSKLIWDSVLDLCSKVCSVNHIIWGH
jgi:acyl-CoA oxidase